MATHSTDTLTEAAAESEVSILSRIFSNKEGELSPEMARHLLGLGFSESDKARIHDLAVRNQADALSHAEKEEFSAYTKAGTLLTILKSRARRVLGEPPPPRSAERA